MEIRFANNDLNRMYTEAPFVGGFSVDVVRAFRRCVQFIVAATDERDLYAVKSRHFEKLKGNRSVISTRCD